MSYKNWRWRYATIGAYEFLDSLKGWKRCPLCKEWPKVWIFDNGRYAKCCCGEKYGKAQAGAESIMSVHIRNNGNVSEYNCDDLRKNWNKYVEACK